jgi:hypothetical protein
LQIKQNQTKPLTLTWENIKVEKSINSIKNILFNKKTDPVKKIIKNGKTKTKCKNINNK